MLSCKLLLWQSLSFLYQHRCGYNAHQNVKLHYIFYEWQTRRCVYVDLFIYASILAPTKVPVATGIETLSSAPVVYRDAVLLMGQYGKPTNTTLIHL